MHTEVISTIKNSKVGSEKPIQNFFVKNFPWLSLIILPFLKISSAIKVAAVICLFVLSTFLKPLYAIPQDGVVTDGNATISQSGSYTQITQTSDRAIINWQSFNIANGEHVHFQQPSAGSIALNRINPANGASQIYGRLSATGQVWLINPAGILFGPTAQIDVNGLLATTANIKNSDFMAGRHEFIQSPDWHGAIINEGNIRAADYGMVALVAPAVINRGIIQARLGKIALAAGNQFTVDFYGDQLINFGVNAKVTQSAQDVNGNEVKAGITNEGSVIADGGKILMTARVAKDIVDNVINMTGVAQAKAVYEKGGEIVLLGGDEGIVNVTGKMDVSGRAAGQKGGKVKVTGEKVGLFAGTRIDAAGSEGGGEVLIGGDYQGKNPDVFNATRTLVQQDVEINASALDNGNGGKVITWANDDTQFYGSVLARGGDLGGDGGFVEISGKELLSMFGTVDTRAPQGQMGTLLLDPRTITIVAGNGGSLASGASFLTTPSADVTIGADLLTGATSNITLQANRDIMFNASVTLGSTGGATPQPVNLTAQAGRRITVSSGVAIAASGASNISFTANETVANGVSSGDRGIGTASIDMLSGSSITSNGGNITLLLNTGAGLSESNSGNINITTINAGAGTVSISNLGPTAGSGIVGVDATNLITGASVALNVSGAASGAGGIGTSGTPIRITATNLAANLTTQTGGIFISSPTQGINLGSVASLNGITNTTSSTTLTAAGAITDSAASNMTGQTFTVNSGATTNNITLDNSNDFGTVVITQANNVTLTDANSIILGASTVSGTLNVNSSGAITDSGNLAVTGIATFAAGSGNNITLDNANNFSTIAITSGNDVTLNDANDLILGASSISGNLNVTTTNGAITQSGAIIANGASKTATFAAGGANNITLNDSLNNFTTVAITSGNIVTLQDTNALDLGSTNVSGTYTITAGGAVTDSANLTINALNLTTVGGFTLDSSSNNITSAILSNSGTGNTTLNVNNSLLTINGFTSTVAGSTNTISNNLGDLTIAGAVNYLSGSQNLNAQGTLNINNAITSSGSSFIATTSTDFVLDPTNGSINNSSNTVQISARGNLFIGASGAGLSLSSAELNKITAGSFNARTASGGTATVDGVVSTDTDSISDFSINAGGGGTVTFSGTSSSFASNVYVSATANINVNTDITAVNRFFNFTSGASGAINLSANMTGATGITLISNTNGIVLNNPVLLSTTNSDITFTGAVNANANTLTMATGTGSISASNASNNFGTVAINNAGAVTLVDANALILGGVNASSLNITTSGALTDSGAIIVSGTSTLAAGTGNDITLDNDNNFGTIAITSGNNVTLNDTNALVFGASTINGNFIVTTAGAITQSGAISANGPGKTATFTAGALNDITLNNAGNNFNQISITSGNNVTLQDVNVIALGTSNISGNLNVTANDGIVQDGAITANGVGKTATFTTSAISNIHLMNTSNDFTNITIGNGDDVYIRDINGIDIGASNAGVLTVITTNGDITQSGAITAQGLDAETTSGNVTLTHASNAFQSAYFAGNTVTVNNTTALNLAGANANTLTLTNNGAINNNGGDVIVTGKTSITAGAGNDITLGSAGNNFGTLSIVSGNNVTLRDADGLIFDTSTISGTLVVNATGAITQSGVLTVTGATTLAAGSTNNITLNAANAFSSIGISSGNNVTINDINALVLNASTISGTLDVTTHGAITDNGNLTVAGVATFDAGNTANNITLDNDNNFSTVRISAGNDVTIKDANALILGASTISGNLIVTTSGDITQSGAITVNGTNKTATFAAGSGNNITLNSSNDFINLIVSSGNDVSITDANTLNLAGLNVSGNLNLTTTGAITDSAASIVTGTARFDAGSSYDITLNQADNNFGSIGITSGNNVTVVDVSGLILAASTISGDLNVTAGIGGITQSGAISANGVGKTATFSVGSDVVLLDNTDNNFRNVNVLSASEITLVDVDDINIAGISGSPNNIFISAGGAITDSGSITGTSLGVLAKDGIILDAGHSVSFVVLINDLTGNITFTTSAGTLNLQARNTATSGGNITITNTTGGIFADNDVDITTTNLGDITLTANGVLQLLGDVTTPNGSINLTGSDLIMAVAQSIFSSSDAINVNATGDVLLGLAGSGMSIFGYELNQMVTDTVNINAGNNSTMTISNFGDPALTDTYNNLNFNATNGTGQIDFNTLTSTFGTNVTATANNDINVDVAIGTNTAKTLVLNANNGDTNGNLNVNANITAAGGLTLQVNNGGQIVAGDVTLATTNSDINLNGAVNGVGHTLTFNVGTGNIEASNSENAFGTIAVSNANSVLISNKNSDIDLGDMNVDDYIDIFAEGGNITNSGDISVGGTAFFNATSGNITLNQNNDFSTIDIGSGNNVAINDVNSLVLANANAGTIGGTLQVIANGAITQVDGLSVTGAATFTAGSGNITLDAANNFSSVGIISGNNVILNDISALVLTNSTISGDLNVTTDGQITQSGAIIANGTNKTATFAAGSANNILLDDNSNDFTSVLISSGNNANIADTNALILGAVTINGGLISTAGTDLTASDNITVGSGNNVALTATAGNLTIAGILTAAGAGTINLTANDLILSGSIAHSGGSTIINSNAALNLGTSGTGMTISGTELQSIASNGLTLKSASGSNILIGAISSTNSANVGAVTLDATTGSGGAIQFGDNASFSNLSALGNSISLSNTLTGTNGIILTASNGISLSADAVLASTNSSISLVGALNGADNDLTINAGSGTTTFNGAMSDLGSGTGAALILNSSGETVFLNTVATNSGITAAGAVTFNDDVTLGNGDTASSFNGDVTLNNLIFTAADGATFGNAGSDNFILSSGASSLTSTNAAFTFNAAVSGAQNLSINAGSATTTFNAGISNLGSGTGAALTLTSSGSTVFNSTVAANSGITATGAVTFSDNVILGNGDTASSFNGNVTFDGLTFTAADGATFGDAGSDTVTLSSSTVNLASTNAAFIFNAATTGAQNLTINSGSAATTFNGAISNLGSGTGAALTLSSSGATTFANTVAANSGITANDAVVFNENVTLGNGDTASTFNGDVTLNGLTFTSADGATFGNASSDTVTLSSGAVNLASTNAAFIFNAATTGAQNLTINSGSAATTFNGAVSNLGSGIGAALTLASSGTTTFANTVAANSGINASGAVVFNENVTLGNGDTATSFNGNVTLDGLTFTAADGATFGDAGSDTVTLSSGAVNLASTNAAFTFNAAVSGAQNLTINSGSATTTFNGTISNLGSGTGAALTLSSTGSTIFGNTVAANSGINAIGAVIFSDDVNLGNGDTASSFNGNVTLDGLTFTAADGATFGDAGSDTVTLSGGAVNLASTNAAFIFNAATTGAQNLTVNSGSAATTFNGAISNLGSGIGAALTLASSGTTTFANTVAANSGINASGAVVFNENVTLANGDTASSFNGNVTFDGLTFTAADGATFGDAGSDTVTLSSGAINLISTNAAFTFNAATTGAQNLSINAGSATTTFNAGINNLGGGTGAALTLTSSGSTVFNSTVAANSGIAATGAVTFSDNVTLGNGDTASSFNSNVTFDGLTFTAADGATFGDAGSDTVTLSGGAVNLASSNAAFIFNAATTGAQNLTINSGSAATTFNGAISNLGTGTGAALTLSSSGATTFANTVAANSGINASGAVVFNENVTLGNGDTASSFNGNVTLDGLTFTAVDGATFGDAGSDTVTLSSSAVNLASTNAAFIFNAATTGAQNLTINSGSAATTFNGAISNLGSGIGAALILNSNGTTTFANTVAANSGITANGAVIFNEDVTLGNGDTASSFNNNVTFNGLTFTAADGATFGDAGSDTVTLSNGAVNLASTNAAFTFNAAVSGAQNLTINSGSAATTFNAAISNLGSGTGAALTLSSTGSTIFGSTVAANSGINAIGAVTFSDNVTLGNGDTASSFNGNVTLDGLTFTAADGATFGDTISDTFTLSSGAINLTSTNAAFTINAVTTGAQNLSINAGSGTTTFNGAINNLGTGTGAALTLASTGATVFGSTVAANSGITAVGAVTFNDDVNLSAGNTASTFNSDVTLDGLTFTSANDVTFGNADSDNLTLSGTAVNLVSSGAAFTLNAATNGAQALNINANGVTINGSVGNLTPLASLNVTGPLTLAGTAITTSGNQTYNNAITLTSNIGLATQNAGSAINFVSTIDGLHELTLTGSTTSTITFGGEVGSIAQLAKLEVGNVGAINLSNNISTIGMGIGTLAGNASVVNMTSTNAHFNDARDLVTTGGTVNVASGVYSVGADLNKSLNLVTTGSVVLSNLTTSAAIGIRGNWATSSGNFDIANTVTLLGTTNLNSGNNNINIDGSINGNHALTLTSNNAINVDANLGNSTALNSLTFSGNGVTRLGANINTQGNTLTFNTAVVLTDNVTLTDSGTTGIVFNNTVNDSVANTHDLTLSASSGTVSFGGIVGGTDIINLLTINNTNNVTSSAAVNASTINITSNNIAGTYNADNITLVGANNYTATVNAGALTLGGSNGADITGVVNNISGTEAAQETNLAVGASGNFFVNGCAVGSATCIPVTPATTPTTITQNDQTILPNERNNDLELKQACTDDDVSDSKDAVKDDKATNGKKAKCGDIKIEKGKAAVKEEVQVKKLTLNEKIQKILEINGIKP